MTESDKEIVESQDQQLEVLNDIPGEIIDSMENDLIESLKTVNPSSTEVTSNMDILQSDLSEEFEAIFATEETDLVENSIEQFEIESPSQTVESNVEDSVEGIEINTGCFRQETDIDTLLTQMLESIKRDSSVKRRKWSQMDVKEFEELTKTTDDIYKSFYKSELQICLKSVSQYLQEKQIHFANSWNKGKLTDVLYQILYNPEAVVRRKCRLQSLKTLCNVLISKFPKDVLNIIRSEHEYPLEEEKWYKNSIFQTPTIIEGLNTEVVWYSKPEYVQKRYAYQFCLLDCHHLLTNARTKCCSSGIPSAGIEKCAWTKVAYEDGCISRALVEDLVDKQNSAYAQKTFSAEVEASMRNLNYSTTADFCKLIREWYEAEDEPGLDAVERCRRRLNLREWLCSNIKIGTFPPPGSHVNSIPVVMFEGLMTNIERRIQLFPFVKRGHFNVRALGSLESENFFGAFQDLDPKGSGVLRPDDVGAALSTACEIT